jgi:protein SCO1/2
VHRAAERPTTRSQAKYAQDLFDQHDSDGWQFWTGSKESIAELTEAVGFRYTFDPSSKQYNHSTAAIFIAPSGKITRYLYELGFTGSTFKMATVEAGEGRVGSSMDMVALWCVHYNPMENRYSASARQILSVVAGIFATVGLMISIPFWLVSKGRKVARIAPMAAPTPEIIDHHESIRHTSVGGDRDTIG